MPYKRNPTEEEIAVLAERFRGLWRDGEAMLPWLRHHGGMLKECVATEWTWDAVARALTAANITYQTGRAWTAANLRRKISEALEPAKNPPPPPRRQGTEPAAQNVAPHDQSPAGTAEPPAALPRVSSDVSVQPTTRPAPVQQWAPRQKLPDEAYERLEAKYGENARVERRARELRGEVVPRWTEDELEEWRVYEEDLESFPRFKPARPRPQQDEFQ